MMEKCYLLMDRTHNLEEIENIKDKYNNVYIFLA